MIRRLNGADNLRRSDSIRNNCPADQRSLNYRGAKRGITAASAAGFRARTRPPGTEFLDAETGHQKSLVKCANGRRDQNPGSDWPKIPAETPYSASDRKPAVCGDWMVVCAVRYEPVSGGNSLLTGKLTGNFSRNTRFCTKRLVSCAVISKACARIP